MQIHITEDERATLERLLGTALREIRVEVRHAHESETKAELRQRENVLRHILVKVEALTPVFTNV